MLEDEASKTALGVAYSRAAHQLFDPPPLLFEDRIALPLLGPGAEEKIRGAKAFRRRAAAASPSLPNRR